jgi:hypothetical protein
MLWITGTDYLFLAFAGASTTVLLASHDSMIFVWGQSVGPITPRSSMSPLSLEGITYHGYDWHIATLEAF